MHRRKSVATDMHDGDIETNAGQLIGQSLPLPEEHADRAILSHVVMHDAVIWAAVHLSPQVARGPALPPASAAPVAPDCALPLHPNPERSATSAAPYSKPKFRMMPLFSMCS
jgi:hypothetical protein